MKTTKTISIEGTLYVGWVFRMILFNLINVDITIKNEQRGMLTVTQV